ncbi:hypothetical protein M2168_003267 [Streptomyces sp. CZ24]|nr:hypothetical protein [Streptomyces sp. CZ24]
MVPTWTTSSIGSFRLRKRAAAYRTRGRLASMRALRTRACSAVPGSTSLSWEKRSWVSARVSAPRLRAAGSEARPGRKGALRCVRPEPVPEPGTVSAPGAAPAPGTVFAPPGPGPSWGGA